MAEAGGDLSRFDLRPLRVTITGMAGQTLDSANHVVQLALTPIFFLAGLAQLLNVFTARLGRIADRIYRIAHDPDASRAELRRLRLRSRILDAAVLLAAGSGGLTCCAALVMFLGALRNRNAGALLFIAFGGALAFAIAALAAFSAETFLSGRSIQEKADDVSEQMERRDAGRRSTIRHRRWSTVAGTWLRPRASVAASFDQNRDGDID